ncbi:MAG: S24 family peptidase [Oligoflexia bacterium]|nr:S24 family peptidase [Oligoflexia bacterium]
MKSSLFGITRDFEEDYQSLDAKFLDGSNTVIIKTKSERMSPTLKKGDILVVNVKKKYIYGNVGVFKYMDDVIIARAKKIGTQIILYFDDNGKEIQIDSPDELIVLGKVETSVSMLE